MQTAEEIRAQIVEKAEADEEFRSRLVADPKNAIEQEFDFKIPASIEIQVHEDSESVAHLTLPPHPKLSETQLANMSGGKSSALYWCL